MRLCFSQHREEQQDVLLEAVIWVQVCGALLDVLLLLRIEVRAFRAVELEGHLVRALDTFGVIFRVGDSVLYYALAEVVIFAHGASIRVVMWIITMVCRPQRRRSSPSSTPTAPTHAAFRPSRPRTSGPVSTK